MIAVVTDSTCDLPQELAEEAGVHIVPAYVNVGTDSLRDGIDLSRDAFYKMLPTLKTVPRTSSPSPGMFIEVYQDLLMRASHVVSVHVASQFSGIYTAATTAAAHVAPERITTLDSGQVTMGLGWAVLAGARSALGGANRETVLHSIQDTLKAVKVYAVLDTLEYLARSGRVDLVRLGLSTILNIKPMIEIRDGTVLSVGKIRTWSRATQALLEQTQKLGPVQALAILHTNVEQQAREFQDRVKSVLSHSVQTHIVNVTTAVGVHAGPGALGIAAVKS